MDSKTSEGSSDIEMGPIVNSTRGGAGESRCGIYSRGGSQSTLIGSAIQPFSARNLQVAQSTIRAPQKRSRTLRPCKAIELDPSNLPILSWLLSRSRFRCQHLTDSWSPRSELLDLSNTRQGACWRKPATVELLARLPCTGVSRVGEVQPGHALGFLLAR